MAEHIRERVTHRRTAVVAAAVAATILTAVVTGRPGASADGTGPPPVPDTAGHAVVEPGQSLWEVARHHGPEGVDPRAYVQRIVELNDLHDGAVRAWTVVLLPAS